MPDASTRFIIAADDRTKAAISSAISGFKKLEKGVKSTMGVMNASLGFFVGAKLTQGFKAIVDATAESEEGQKGFAQALQKTKDAFSSLLVAEGGIPDATKNLEELNTVLKDPAIVAAADAITSTLLTGFTKAAVAIAETVGGLRSLGVQMGLFEAKTAQEEIDKISAKVDRIRTRRKSLQNELRFANEKGFRAQLQKQIDDLTQQELALEAAQQKLLDTPPKPTKDRKSPREAAEEREKAAKEAEKAAKAQKDRAEKLAKEFQKQSDDISDYVRDLSQDTADIIGEDYEELRAQQEEAIIALGETRLANERRIHEITTEEESEAHNLRLERIATFTDAFKSAYDDILRTGKFSVREYVQFLLTEFARKEIFATIDAIGDRIADAMNPRSSSGGKSKSGWLSTILDIGAGLLGSFGSGTGSIGKGISAASNRELLRNLPPIVNPISEGSMALQRFQHGGEFSVGGAGGTDSQLVAFRASPGERVSVTPSGADQENGGAPSITINNNIDARGATADAMAMMPEILRRNNAQLETKIIEGLRRRKYAI